jgi:predicted RNA binding protein YcfA (HicA-like mRNA interferase family)
MSLEKKRVTNKKFSELVRLLEQNGFKLIREKGSIRYYSKPGVDRLIRVDYHERRKYLREPAMLF